MARNNQTLIGALAILAVIVAGGYSLVGPVIFLYSMMFAGGLVVWFFTAYRADINIQRILALYLLTVLLFIGHVSEEYVAHVEVALGRIMHITLTQREFLTVAVFASPIIWLSGPLLVMAGQRIGYFLISVFLFGMMFGEVSHFAFPFLENGTFHYVAGMYTCALPIIAAWVTFVIFLREVRKERRPQGEICDRPFGR